MKLQKIYPLLTLVFFISTCVLLLQQFYFYPEGEKIKQNRLVEMELDPSIQDGTIGKIQISDEEIQRLMDIENEQKELVLLFERVSADLKDATNSKQILNQLLLGRTTLRDFGSRFINFKLFKKSGGFVAFLRSKTKTYLSDGKLGIDHSGIKKKNLNDFRKEITKWIVSLSKEEIESMARFLSFFFAETLYDIPMTMLASRMTPELEEINFGTPVLMQEVLTTPSRDVNGEMNEKKPTVVEKYSMAQQFFFRRGPKISEKAVVFLKAYLSYTDL